MALRFDALTPIDDSDDELAHVDDPVRNVRVSDKRLVNLAMRATQLVDWTLLAQCNASRDDKSKLESLLSDWIAHKHKAARSRLDDSSSGIGSTRIYTRDSHSQSLGHSFAVVAHATIPCSLQELQFVLETPTTERFCELLRAVFRDDFRAGELVHATATATRVSTRAPPELLVKAVAFESSGFFSGGNSEEWCYLDFAQHVQQPSSDDQSNGMSENRTERKTSALRKTFVALDPEECFVGTLAAGRAVQSRDVVAGLLLDEDADGRATQVAMYAQHLYESAAACRRSKTSSSSPQQRPRVKKSASKATVRARLLRIASSLERLGAISRRRRLGVQVLVDELTVTSTNASCPCCKRSFVFTRKRRCSLCGYSVCERCSAIEDRERRESQRMRIDRVRICNKCIVCVDRGTYDDVTLESLAPAQVVADAPDTAPRLLGSALVRALQSLRCAETETNAVVQAMRALVCKPEGAGRDLSMPAPPALEPVDALCVQLDALPLPPLDACVLSNADKRSYRNEHPLDPDSDVRYVLPPPEVEAKRLDVVRANGFAAMRDVPGLDVVCAIARDELACLGAMVTVVDQEHYSVTATTIVLPTRTYPRHEGFCSRTVLDDTPLVVPHVQADVRFSYMQVVRSHDLGFYCGFPLVAQDGTVIGSLCCFGPRTKRLTRSECAIASRLATAASLILQAAAAHVASD